eukprot:1154240-Lingulodinium_polyedra.AAC.1
MLVEAAKEEISFNGEQAFADGAQMTEPIRHVSFSIFGAIKGVISNSLLSRARSCEGRGLELWRLLRTEWVGAAAYVADAKARQFADPPRCATSAALWDELPRWLQLGEEVATGGLD